MLTEQERAHAESILDEQVTLEPIAHKRILIASVVRKPPEVVEPFIKTLRWQQLRDKRTVDVLFVPNFAPSDPFAGQSMELLRNSGALVWDNVQNPGGDYGDGADTRAWTPQAWHRVGQIKDQVFRYALSTNYDYVWLVDADVLCDPGTLQSLLDSDNDIVAGVYWTHWHRPKEDDAQKQHAAPQVWLRHPYFLDGRGWTEAEFREALATRQLVEVWGLGACTLFKRAALEKGVSFAPWAQLAAGPMADGEDRHLCARATALHVGMYADAWPNIYHAYHPDEYHEIPEWMNKLDQPQPVVAFELGDYVSARITPLEPVREGPRVTLPPRQHVRGRLGLLPILPELEEQLFFMKRGDKAVVAANYPTWHPVRELAGQRRLFELELFDVRKYELPPVLDREIMQGNRSQRLIDAVGLTEEQLGEVVHGPRG